MQKKKKRNKSSHNMWYNNFFILLLFFTSAFIFVDSRLRPLVIETARYKVQSLVTQAANIAIIEEMEKTSLSYGDLITVSRDEMGDVSLLSYNTLEVNRLKSQITSSVIEKVNQLEQTDIFIPLGNPLADRYNKNTDHKNKNKYRHHLKNTITNYRHKIFLSYFLLSA